MVKGSKVPPHRWGRRKTHFSVQMSMIFGTDIRGPAGCRKTCTKNTCLDFWPLVYAAKIVPSDFFEGFIVRPPTLNNCKWCPQACPDSRRRSFCGNNMVEGAMHFMMKNVQLCFSLRKSLSISSAIQKSLENVVALPWCT